jgi:hypothetical protein
MNQAEARCTSCNKAWWVKPGPQPGGMPTCPRSRRGVRCGGVGVATGRARQIADKRPPWRVCIGLRGFHNRSRTDPHVPGASFCRAELDDAYRVWRIFGFQGDRYPNEPTRKAAAAKLRHLGAEVVRPVWRYTDTTRA